MSRTKWELLREAMQRHAPSPAATAGTQEPRDPTGPRGRRCWPFSRRPNLQRRTPTSATASSTDKLGVAVPTELRRERVALLPAEFRSTRPKCHRNVEHQKG